MYKYSMFFYRKTNISSITKPCPFDLWGPSATFPHMDQLFIIFNYQREDIRICNHMLRLPALKQKQEKKRKEKIWKRRKQISIHMVCVVLSERCSSAKISTSKQNGT